MRDYNVSNLKEAYAYILDCNLATIEDLAMASKSSKKVLTQALNISQQAFDNALKFNVDLATTRGIEVLKEYDSKVIKLFEKYYKIFHNNTFTEPTSLNSELDYPKKNFEIFEQAYLDFLENNIKYTEISLSKKNIKTTEAARLLNITKKMLQWYLNFGWDFESSQVTILQTKTEEIENLYLKEKE